MAYRSQAPRMQRPPRAPRAASASSRPDDGWHFHEPRGHVHSSKTTSVPSERPQSKRIPTNGIVMRHGVNAGKIALTNHRMKPTAQPIMKEEITQPLHALANNNTTTQ